MEAILRLGERMDEVLILEGYVLPAVEELRSPAKSEGKGTTNLLVLMKDRNGNDCLLLGIDSKSTYKVHKSERRSGHKWDREGFCDDATKYHKVTEHIIATSCGNAAECLQIWEGMDASARYNIPLHKIALAGYKVALKIKDHGSCEVLVCGLENGELKAYHICSEDDYVEKDHTKYQCPVKVPFTALGSGGPFAESLLKDVTWENLSETEAMEYIEKGMLRAALSDCSTGGKITHLHWDWQKMGFETWKEHHVMQLFHTHFQSVDTANSLFMLYHEDFSERNIKCIPNLKNYGHVLAKLRCGLLIRMIEFMNQEHKKQILRASKDVTVPGILLHRGNTIHEYKCLESAKLYLLSPKKLVFLVVPSKKFLNKLQIVGLDFKKKFEHLSSFRQEYDKALRLKP